MATRFTSLGSKLIQVILAPSTPLYTRRSSLLATFGSKNVVAVSARILANTGFQYFQKITSTAPLQALISAQDGSSELEILEIDGSIDWVITYPRYLHSYWGDSLVLSQKGSWLKFFQRPIIVSGRGITALQTIAGPIHKLQVESGQSIVVNRQSLVAYSIDSNLHNPIIPLRDIVHYNKTPQNAFDKRESESESGVKTDAKSDVKSQSKAHIWWNRVKSGISWLITATKSSPYIQITGPSTLYISSPWTSSLQLSKWIPQSSTNSLETQLHIEASNIINSIQNNKQKSKNSGLPGPPEAHLKIATVINGKVDFKSTDSFDKPVNYNK